uniref:SCP domain-containing protein n=1 Tax=Rhabditophanes sp. KR3021 TaxID=114890 RepID=A0AC35U1E9_9BILA
MARTGCHEPNATSCNTGFCGPSIDCTMKKISEFKKPFTTAEFQLGSTGSHIYTLDRYAVHLNNGYNRDISIKPTSGTFTKKDEISNWCKEIEMCKENLLYPCPDKMRVRLNNYDTIGCHTSCTKKMYSKRVCDTNGYLDPSYASFFENQEDEEKRIHSDVLSFYADKCPHYVNYGDKSSEESKYYFCTGKNENTNADYQVTICGENQP